MRAADMRSEWANPAWNSPGITISLGDGSSADGPCLAWPRWARRVEMVRRELIGMSSRSAEPPAPGA